MHKSGFFNYHWIPIKGSCQESLASIWFALSPTQLQSHKNIIHLHSIHYLLRTSLRAAPNVWKSTFWNWGHFMLIIVEFRTMQPFNFTLIVLKLILKSWVLRSCLHQAKGASSIPWNILQGLNCLLKPKAWLLLRTNHNPSIILYQVTKLVFFHPGTWRKSALGFLYAQRG